MFLNSFFLLQVTAMYFSRLIFSCRSETKSSNWYVMVFKTLTYKKYLPKIMRWLRTKQQVRQRIIPNITSSSDSSSFVLLEIEYHSWMHAVYKQMPQGLTLRRTKGTGGRGNFFHFCVTSYSLVKFGACFCIEHRQFNFSRVFE